VQQHLLKVNKSQVRHKVSGVLKVSEPVLEVLDTLTAVDTRPKVKIGVSTVSSSNMEVAGTVVTPGKVKRCI
jgi:hypothetical protein